MRVYQLTNEERLKVEALNESRKDNLLIVCDFSDIGLGCVVQLDDLEDTKKFPNYREQVDVTLDVERTRDIEVDTDSKVRVR
jgi:hypothetical protein